MIAIVGIMAAGLVMALNPMAQIQKAQNAKRKSDLNQIQKALEAYYNDYGQYPLHSQSGYKIKTKEGAVLEWGTTGWQYINSLPKDPSSRRSYVYYSNEQGRNQSYYLYASLEKESGNSPQNIPDGAVCGMGIACNYGVSSSNVSP